MEQLDYTSLAQSTKTNKNKVLYLPNKQFFTKIAFDVFQLNTTPIQSLWTLEDDEDGKQYLVAQYDEEEKPIEANGSINFWNALSDKDSKNVTLLYKDIPIQRFASSEFGFTDQDIYIFQKALVKKLSSDKEFVNKLLKSQPDEKRKSILEQFPELA